MKGVMEKTWEPVGGNFISKTMMFFSEDSSLAAAYEAHEK